LNSRCRIWLPDPGPKPEIAGDDPVAVQLNWVPATLPDKDIIVRALSHTTEEGGLVVTSGIGFTVSIKSVVSP
jgi:hypothetical protein